jgi:excisionase family DNA binding protein
MRSDAVGMLDVQLITVAEAAQLLSVSTRTVHAWIEKEAIPYIRLPSTGGKPSYRIPLRGLLESLSGTYDLAAEIERGAAT